MKVLVDASYGAESLDLGRIEQTALFALERADAPDGSEVSITFVDDDEMAALNGEYRGKEGPTDVLSFECDGLEDGFPEPVHDAPYELGDIVIAPDVARRQADEYGSAFLDEADMLVVHGVLHLLGYDHVADEDAAVMEPLQQDVLKRLRAFREA